MMGGQLSLGGRWKCLPLRDVEIAKFVSRCKQMAKAGETSPDLFDDALEVLAKAEVEGVPAHMLQATLKASIGPDHQSTVTPKMLVDALTLTQLTWHGRNMLIAFESRPYVVTDLAEGVTHTVWHLEN